jgi:hypothetical protein
MTLDSVRHAAVHRRESLRLPRGLHRTRVSEMRPDQACALRARLAGPWNAQGT